MKDNNLTFLEKAIQRYKLLYNYNTNITAYEPLVIRVLSDKYDLFRSKLYVSIFVNFLLSSGEKKQYYKYDSESSTITICSEKPKGYQSIELPRNNNNKVDWALNGTELLYSKLTKTHKDCSSSSSLDSAKYFVSRIQEEKLGSIIVSYASDVASKETYHKFIEENSSIIFFNLFKSLVVGEYIYLDDYSQILGNAINAIDEYSDDIKSTARNTDIWREFVRVFRKIQRFCYTLKKVIYPDNHNIDIESVGIDGYVNRRDVEIDCQNISKVWTKLLGIILNITFIDFVYVTNRTNIEVLYSAFEYIKLLPKEYPYIITTEVRNEIITPVSAKLKFLMLQMLNQGVADNKYRDLLPQYYFVDNDSNILFKENKAIYEPIDYNYFKKVKHRDLRNHSDLNKYNTLCKEIFQIHKTQSKILEEIIKDDTYSSQRVIELIDQYLNNDANTYTAPFLYYTISYSYQQAINAISNNENEKIDKTCKVLNTLLNKLSQYIEKYKNGMTGINQVRRYFQDSIYEWKDGEFKPVKIIEDGSINHTILKNSIVSFVSYQAKPINIPFLINFLNFHKLETGKIEIKILSKRTNEEVNNVHETLKHERNYTIQILGLLGSFIAFVSIISTGAANVVNSQTLFVYLVGGALLISLFVALLKFVTPSSQKCRIREGIFILIMCGCLLGMIYYLKENNIIEKEEQRTEKVKENGHTIIFNQNTNQSNH